MKRKIVKAGFMESSMRIMAGNVTCNTFYILLNANKNFKIDAFKKGLNLFVQDMPIFTCSLAKGKWRDKWVPIEDYDINKIVEVFNMKNPSSVDKASCCDEMFLQFSALKEKHIDIQKEAPLKVKIFNNEKTGDKLIVFCVHHCLSDGRGWMQTIKLIGSYYDAVLNNKTIKLEKNYRKMSKFVFSVSLSDYLRTIKGLSKPSKLQTMKPVLDTSGIKAASIDYNDTSIEKIIITEEQLNSIKKHYKAYNFTVNDILMHLVMKITDRYNLSLKEPNSYIGTGALVDLRRYFKKDVLSIANYFALESLEVDRSCIENLPKLAEELSAFKKRPLGLSFICPILLTSIFPVSTLEKIIGGMMEGFAVQSYMGLATTNFGKFDEYIAPYGSCIEGGAAIPSAGVHGFPSILVSSCKGIRTLYFIKYNDKDNLTREIKNQLNELLTELYSSEKAAQ